MFGRRDVPLDKDASTRFIPWLIGLMVYLAALALAAGFAVNNLSERWDRGLADHLTVQVPPPLASEGEVDPGARVEAVLDILRGTDGVREAAVLDEAHTHRLLEPWLGEGLAREDLPIPALIAAELDPRQSIDIAGLQAEVEAVAPGASVDDHQRTLGQLLDIARSLQVLAFTVMGLIAGAAVVTVTFATRTGLAVHRQVIELLHLIGAHDAYVARQFQVHALKLGLLGGVTGLAVALGTVIGLNRILAAGESAIIPDLTLTPLQWGVLAMVPLLTAAIAMVTARITVLRTLARLS